MRKSLRVSQKKIHLNLTQFPELKRQSNINLYYKILLPVVRLEISKKSIYSDRAAKIFNKASPIARQPTAVIPDDIMSPVR